MSDSKSIFASRTVWANAIGLIALLASLLGYRLSEGEAAALTDAALEIVAAVSLIASTLFRVVATRRIGG
jgi:hypothetical protein